MADVLIITGSSTDLSVTESGLKLLEDHRISYSLRICSAHRTPKILHDIMNDFENDGGKLYICVAGMSAHLAGVVASHTVRPVLAVPVYRQETAGLDSLFSMGQMPKGIPVGTLGFGKHGFINACLLSGQILALSDAAMRDRLLSHRHDMEQKVVADDASHRREFSG